MSEANGIEKNGEALNVDAGPDDRNGIDPHESANRPDSLGAVLRKFFSGPQRPGAAAATRDLKQDRTRALVLLIGGIVGSVLLFVGIFSTPPTRLGERERDRAQPNLGRKEPTGAARLASATPLLNAQVQSDESGQDRVSAADVHNTSQREFPEANPTPAAPDDSLELRASAPPASDRVAIYHRDGTTGTMTTYGYGTPAANAGLTRTQADSSYPGTFNYGPSNSQAALPTTTATTPKSSIVFVRTSVATASPSTSALVSPGTSEHPTVLSAGSHLIARLESAVSSVLKAPVVAVIEYNYEKDGVIVIPAGTKAIGELQQASINGYVGIVFHTLQMPDGRNEKIEAMAMDLQNEPLKGKVTGTNKGRKFLTRTLSGVGTIGAYVVGAGGSGLGQPITGETLLRDRFASNIASAGDQELTNAAFSQNVVVTVPAQTRFFIVFRKAAVEPAASSPLPGSVRSSSAEIPTAQELRELLDLKREINRMYEASAAPPNSTKP